MATGPVPTPPRQGEIWWSAAPPAEPVADDPDRQVVVGISEEQLQDWLSCTAGWKALELTWGALQSCEVRYHQLKPLLQAAMAEAARLGASRLVVRQLDVDEVLGRCVALALSGFPNFTVIKLRELNLYDESMGHLSGALHAAEHLRVLVLESVWASVGGWSALGAAVKVNQSLTTLRVRECLGGAALAALCSALSDQHGALEALRLSHNRLGDAGVEELCKALTRSCTQATSRPSRVAHLDLAHNDAGRQCVPAVAAMLRAVRALRHLDLSYNDLGAEAVRELCSALSYAPHVTSLNLASTGADDSAIEALTRGSLAPATALAVAASGLGGVGVGLGGGGGALATLCLAHNRISARGAALLAAAVRRPVCPLVDVDLGGNALLGEQGAKAWADVLAPSSSSLSSSLGGGGGGGGGGAGACRLRRLVLSGCEVPDAGAFALGAALKSNTSLQELGLAENHISTRGLALLAEVLKVNSTLRLLDVSLNMVGPQGMTPLSRMGHLRGHVVLSKTGDHAVKRVSSCVVKAELLREYRDVEAVKSSREPWEQEEREQAAAAAAGYVNPFLDPSTATAAAVGGTVSGHDGGYNPFLSPSATYVNPFLDPPAAAAPPPPPSNPFLAGDGAPAAVNPFLDPSAAAPGADTGAAVWAGPGPDNPFLSPPRDKPDNPFLVTAVTATGVEGRELATRVLTRLGTHGSASVASDRGGRGSSNGGGDGGDSGSDSRTGVYVSSRSTADEADLVTDLDLRLVDRLLEDLGMANSNPSADIPGAAAAPAAAKDSRSPSPLPVPPEQPQAASIPRVDSFWSEDGSPSPGGLPGGGAESSPRYSSSRGELDRGASQPSAASATLRSREPAGAPAAYSGWAAAMAQLDELSGRGPYEQSYEGQGEGKGYGGGEAGAWAGQEPQFAWGRGQGSGGSAGGGGGWAGAGLGGAPQGPDPEGGAEGDAPAANPFL